MSTTRRVIFSILSGIGGPVFVALVVLAKTPPTDTLQKAIFLSGLLVSIPIGIILGLIFFRLFFPINPPILPPDVSEENPPADTHPENS